MQCTHLRIDSHKLLGVRQELSFEKVLLFLFNCTQHGDEMNTDHSFIITLTSFGVIRL